MKLMKSLQSFDNDSQSLSLAMTPIYVLRVFPRFYIVMGNSQFYVSVTMDLMYLFCPPGRDFLKC